MKKITSLVVFRLDRQRYAVRLEAVERIVRAVELTDLPNAPGIVIGVIDVEGRVLPVVNLRRRLGLPERALSASDHFFIVATSRRSVVLIADEALEVVERPDAQIVDASGIVPHLEHIEGALQLEDGLVLIHDLETFLSLEEAEALAVALPPNAIHGN